jgi:hypothetical protein
MDGMEGGRAGGREGAARATGVSWERASATLLRVLALDARLDESIHRRRTRFASTHPP